MRPDIDTYFMEIARAVAKRSNCSKRKVGAVLVQDKQIVSTGYNGTPRGTKNCDEGGCMRCAAGPAPGMDLDLCICSHGEENAIVQAAYHGVKVSGSTIYTTFCPCPLCAKMIINAGIKEVIYAQEYPLNGKAWFLFEEAGVDVRKLS